MFAWFWGGFLSGLGCFCGLWWFEMFTPASRYLVVASVSVQVLIGGGLSSCAPPRFFAGWVAGGVRFRPMGLTCEQGCSESDHGGLQHILKATLTGGGQSSVVGCRGFMSKHLSSVVTQQDA